MEKDQNINSENQNEEIKENEAEEQNQVEQEISADKTEEVKEVTPEEFPETCSLVDVSNAL